MQRVPEDKKHQHDDVRMPDACCPARRSPSYGLQLLPESLVGSGLFEHLGIPRNRATSRLDNAEVVLLHAGRFDPCGPTVHEREPGWGFQ